MKHSLLLFVLTLLLTINALSQNLDERILMVIDGREIQAGEFTRMYKKLLTPGDTVDIDRYLEQFIVFKLKVAEAISEGFDTTQAFRNELKSYRGQVANNYLIDKDIKEKILKQAYERYLKEINAWHILVSCPPGSHPGDTIATYEKALAIKARLISGEPFEQVAKSSSDDPSVRFNGGNLGYFTVFQMIKPFEDAVYSMKKGELTGPVKTTYGYHIIKVTDIRPARGKIKAAHIMRSVPPNAPDDVAKEAENTINKVYRELLAGASFSELAKIFSDHRESASRGGELNWFGTGEIVTEFAEAAFSLQRNGDFTAPVRTPYGWHIIKRIDKREPMSFEEARAELESKINEAWIITEATKSLVEKLKKEYKFRLNKNLFTWFLDNTDTLITKGYSKYNRRLIPPGALYTFDGQSFSTAEFAMLIENKASPENNDDPSEFLRKSIETCVTDQLIGYENSLLETKNPEFRYLINEFHDGILLFEISEKKIWNKVQNDTAGLKDYYERNINRFSGKKSVEGTLFICRDEGMEKTFYSQFKNSRNISDIEKKLRKKFGNSYDNTIEIKKGTWFEGNTLLPAEYAWKTGLIKTIIMKYPAVIIADRIKEPVPLTFNEVRGEILQEYQDYLESEWTKQLKTKYPVKIHTEVFEEIKRRLINE